MSAKQKTLENIYYNIDEPTADAGCQPLIKRVKSLKTKDEVLDVFESCHKN